MRWNERLQIALPELTRLNGRTVLASIPMGIAAQIATNPLGEHWAYTLLGLPLARLALWVPDVLSKKRLYELEIGRQRKAYQQGRKQVRELRKSCNQKKNKGLHKLGLQIPSNASGLTKEDRQTLDRIEATVDEIERQFEIADLFLQRHLLRVLSQVIEQAVCAMETGQKLAVLLEFLAREDLSRLEAEEHVLREQARLSPTGPMGTLHSQTCRFKAQQIANVRNAQQNVVLYRTQLYALEAGLGNVRGRIASLITIDRSDVGLELEALDTELSALDEGMRLAANAVSGDAYHAGRPYAGHETPPHAAESDFAATKRSSSNESSRDRQTQR